ncbi:DUF4352 domain-containing protein [Schaalia hyovaginalis]|uniref:DUF4352 domain-containing protein n=1 Tax=Schaalia hyovaginalis TaxID=29316 RepID=A0A923IY73_9ACTO|nr:DUF4352 domain-containing protein [Schaalia hyovaginalis]MBB6335737.1 hypothetical protein [Schaalia hyovaginalis]
MSWIHPPLLRPPPLNPQAAAKKPRNTLGLIALIISLVGTVFACIPGAMIVGWILLPISFILGIVALFMKGKSLGLAVGAVIISVIGTVIGIIAFITVLGNALNDAFHEETTTSSPQSAGTQESEPSDGIEAPSSEDAGKTRENPLPIGSSLETSKWTVVINSITLDGTETVVGANALNDAPDPGMIYALINVTATYRGDDAQGAHPWLSIDYVSKDGKTYDSTTSSKLIIPPDQFDTLSTLYNGASATGNFAIEIPADSPEQGVFAVSPDLLADKVFIAAQ